MKTTSTLLLLLTLPASAAISVSLPGNSESAVWNGLTSANYPASAGYPGYFNATDAWPAAINPNAGSTAGATFNKISGGGYFASSSLYDSGIPGTFHIVDSAPMASLQTVVFQADLGTAFAGTPVLNFNGGTQGLLPGFSTSSTGNYSGGFGGPPAPSLNFAWQWDLSSLGDPVTSYEIVWTTEAHGTIYQLNLATGDSFVQAIPEPSACLAALLGLGLTLTRRRRA